MDDQFKGSILKPPAAPIKAPPLIPDGLKTALLFVLLITVVFLLYDSYKFQQASKAQLAQVTEQIQSLEKAGAASESRDAALRGELSQTKQQVGTTNAEFKKTAQQIQMEGQKTKAELSQQLATKAGVADVQAARSEAESKFGQVSSEVGGVKNDVGSVKTDVGTVRADLASTRKDLEGTQRQLVDVKETLTAAVAKNASELDVLRRKGERDFFEFSLPKKGQVTKVGDIQVILKSTDVKKGKFTIDILVDDNRLEKKDSNVNEPLQFLVGKNHLRYELVVNWVQKDKAGGYLSIPKDKTLSAEKFGGD
jgi:septal ring factor EnvC (AmiA/AmiB activator)